MDLAKLVEMKRKEARRMLYDAGIMSIDIQRVMPAERAPGDCPKCGQHIGKGVAMHTKHCKGHDAH
jgi:hypothetical protein